MDCAVLKASSSDTAVPTSAGMLRGSETFLNTGSISSIPIAAAKMTMRMIWDLISLTKYSTDILRFRSIF
mgnify:CR=1 FL=1